MIRRRLYDLAELRKDVAADEAFQREREAEITEERQLSHEEIQRLVRARKRSDEKRAEDGQ
ncbi:MAG: hypothetical protein ACPGU7_12570 [Gammaproteobacteria bacterium]